MSTLYPVGEGTFLLKNRDLPDTLRAQDGARKTRTPAPPEIAKPTALVVDDELLIREFCSDILGQAGFQVRTAADAQEALEVAQADPPAVILLDVMLPGMSGVEALTHFGRVAPLTPVIMITAYASLQSAIGSVKHGAYDYIPKPLEPEAIAAGRPVPDDRLIDLLWGGEAGERVRNTLQVHVSELRRASDQSLVMELERATIPVRG